MSATGIPEDAQLSEKRFLAAEADVQQHSAALKRELSLPDLVFTLVLYITGLGWLGTAAKLGSGHFSFWMLGAVLFYLPTAAVVIHLTQEMPLEGGLYQWAKLRFGELAGFLVAWNLWFYVVLSLSELGIITTNNIAYAAGPSGAWIAESKAILITFSVLITIIPMWVAIRGLSLGKWFHNVGGITLLIVFLTMLAFALPRWIAGNVAMAPIALSMPALTLFNLNIFGKMSFGALGGCEAITVFAGECQDPNSAKVIRRAVLLSAPIVVAIFSIGTACVLVYTAPDKLDLVSAVAQNISRGALSYGIAATVVPVFMTVMLLPRLGSAIIQFNMISRMPMVAGWDHLLPEWFSRLHPRYKTPVGAVLIVGLFVLLAALFANSGSGSQEAYQLLNNSSAICYALTYLVMFAIPLIGSGEKPPLRIRLAAISGFGMTLLFTVLSVFPIIDVNDAVLFSAKVGGVVILVNAAGALLFLRGKAMRERAGAAVAVEL